MRDVVDNNGVIRQHVVYDSFGRRLREVDYNSAGAVIASTDPAAVDELFGYTGRDWDVDTQLQNNRARWYDPATGRWLSQDPIGFAAGDANLYRYVGNRPTNATDPSGLYDQAGHYYMTYLIAKAAGWTDDEAKKLAYFAYLPDLRGRFEAVCNVTSAPNDFVKSTPDGTASPGTPDFVRKYMNNWVHSFGLAGLELPARRKSLVGVISNLAGTKSATWQIGFLIHSLGDTYSHQKAGVGYTYPLGHLADMHIPDVVGVRSGLFQGYALSLFEALGGDINNPSQWKQFQEVIAISNDLRELTAVQIKAAQANDDLFVECVNSIIPQGGEKVADFFLKRMIELAEAENAEMHLQVQRRGLGEISAPKFDPQAYLPSVQEVIKLYKSVL